MHSWVFWQRRLWQPLTLALCCLSFCCLATAPLAAQEQLTRSAEPVFIAPELPEWIHRLCVDNIRIADRKVSVRVEHDDVEIAGTGDLHVIRTPRIVRDYYATTWRSPIDRPSTDS